jgi:hypothetical protein
VSQGLHPLPHRRSFSRAVLLCGLSLGYGLGRQSGLLGVRSVFDGGTHHDCGMFVCRKGVDEPERAGDGVIPHDQLRFVDCQHLTFSMGEDRRVACRNSLAVLGVIACRVFVLTRSQTKVLVLEQKIGELIVDRGRLQVLRKRREILPIPMQRFLEVLRLFVVLSLILKGGEAAS